MRLQRTKVPALAGVLMVLMAVTSACSSSATKPVHSNSSADTGHGAAGSPGVQTAKTFAAKYSSPEDSIGIDVPLSKAPPPKTVYAIAGNVGAALLTAKGLETAVRALGWKVTSQQVDNAKPQDYNTAMESAVAAHPDFIVVGGVSSTVFQQGLREAKAANIPVFQSYATTPAQGSSNGVYAQIAGPDSYYPRGQLLANYAISDSDGKANALFVQLGGFPILDPLLSGTKATFSANCSDTCSFSSLDVTVSDLASGSIPSTTVSYLQSHPNVTYLLFADGQMTTGVVSALKAAGLSGKVKIVSDDGQVANMQAIKDGTEAATVGVPLMMSEWYVADAMARYSLGMSLLPVSKEVLPMQLFTSNNVPNPIAQYDGPTDYQTLFKGLWHV